MITPLACHDKSHAPPGHSCTNAEAVGKDLVVNKLTIEVEQKFSWYARCNICVNHTDHYNHTCKDGTYFCFCADDQFHQLPCKPTVGREDVKAHFTSVGHHHHMASCQPGSPDYMCYAAATFAKLNTTRGLDFWWYSSLAEGYNRTWRVVSVDKIVSRECHTRVFGGVVQATRPKGECLAACGSQATNISSPCWTDCFYKAAMGPESGTPGGAVGGLSMQELTEAWERPFKPMAEGGCPGLPQMRPWFWPEEPPAASASSGAVQRIAR